MLNTSDGQRLAARYLAPGPAAPDGLALVLAHGFTGGYRRPAVRGAAERLARHAAVLAFDFRGHGDSSGCTTLGDLEVFDVAAAVAAARERGYRTVVTCGFSMGASAVLRHAALYGGVEAVVSVSGVSHWYYRDTAPMRRVQWVAQHRLGRLVARTLLDTRICADGWHPAPEAPIEVVDRIAPIPLLIVHGDRDHYLPVDHAEALAAAAAEPVELWVVAGFGHAESGAPLELLDRIGAALPELVDRRVGDAA